MIKIEGVKMPRECVFYKHRTMQHANSGPKENQSLMYHLYLNPENVDLKDAVAFAYGELMQCEMRNKCNVFLGDANPLYMFDKNGRR